MVSQNVSYFSAPLMAGLTLDPTISPDSTDFIPRETRIGRETDVSAVHKRAAGLFIAVRNPGPPDVLVFGDMTISVSAMEVHCRGRLVTLTRQEFKTLAYLLKNVRRVISRDELLNEVWGYERYPSTRTVDNHILRLRKKLESEPTRPRHLLTVHGTGYRFLP